MKGRLYTVSLGCPKNLVDTEYLLGLLREEGIEPVSELAEADMALVNTCAFIQSAVEETIDTVLQLGHLRAQGALKRLVVAGCFVQRYGYKLRKEIPEVDAWLGPGQLHKIKECFLPGKRFFISCPKILPDHTFPRLRTTPFYTAYLKIAEGCSHGCSFCIIPKLRGRYRSRRLDSLVEETKALASQGVKELNIVAQDTTCFGKGLDDGSCLELLLEKLALVQGIRWIRLLYTYPGSISEWLLDLMQDIDAIVPYLDMPLQHVDRGILKSMGREDQGDPWTLVERIRNMNRPVALRTSLMVGFPGETEQAFEKLKDFVKWAEFDHLGGIHLQP